MGTLIAIILMVLFWPEFSAGCNHVRDRVRERYKAFSHKSDADVSCQIVAIDFQHRHVFCGGYAFNCDGQDVVSVEVLGGKMTVSGLKTVGSKKP